MFQVKSASTDWLEKFIQSRQIAPYFVWALHCPVGTWEVESVCWLAPSYLDVDFGHAS